MVVVTLRACLQESGEPQGIEVTRLAVVEKYSVFTPNPSNPGSRVEVVSLIL